MRKVLRVLLLTTLVAASGTALAQQEVEWPSWEARSAATKMSNGAFPVGQLVCVSLNGIKNASVHMNEDQLKSIGCRTLKLQGVMYQNTDTSIEEWSSSGGRRVYQKMNLILPKEIIPVWIKG